MRVKEIYFITCFKNYDFWIRISSIVDIESIDHNLAGKFTFNDMNELESFKRRRCIALRYVDDNGQPTSIYPMNPNGSVDAIAAISSPDGRHLVIFSEK